MPDSTGATLLRWSIATVKDYQICANRLASLVDAIDEPVNYQLPTGGKWRASPKP